ncbi:MAG: IS1595 family transposase, partial [Flavicella sp.]
WHIQAYFDEFCFRINRSQYKESIFHKTILRMVLQKPKCQKNIKQTLGV